MKSCVQEAQPRNDPLVSHRASSFGLQHQAQPPLVLQDHREPEEAPPDSMGSSLPTEEKAGDEPDHVDIKGNQSTKFYCKLELMISISPSLSAHSDFSFYSVRLQSPSSSSYLFYLKPKINPP